MTKKPIRTAITVKTPSLKLKSTEILGMTGSCPELGNWSRAIPADNGDTAAGAGSVLSSFTLAVTAPFEYKFVIADRATGAILRWEDGPNRVADLTRSHITVPLPRIAAPAWKAAGTASPVFSLRSRDGFGVGEFNDLKKMIDWAVVTGQKIIQLLPINDTTMTHTKEDSYPYNANSAFALHPQFLHLPDCGVPEDEEYNKIKDELNALDTVDYERVNNEKTRLLRKAFKAGGRRTLATKAYRDFVAANGHWLFPYAAFRVLTDIYGTPDFKKWGPYSKCSDAVVAEIRSKYKEDTDFHCFEQYHLFRQFASARAYARENGVLLKGDLPIGISPTSCDAWLNPSLFNLNSCAGAPPDAFSATGQNWGFPTYNWDRMAKDGYAWWKARLGKMAECFDAFRIDHILGFFRIWEIPKRAGTGLLGHFSPALPYSEAELASKGFDLSGGRYTVPPEGDPTDVLFVKDPHRKGYWHPRIGAQNSSSYNNLDQWHKDAYNALYDDFFYRRHNDFWRESAMKKLPDLLAATDMLACGEDLGMIPDCVPEVMRELQILSLEIETMPKLSWETFADVRKYPYMSVCTTSTHDMNPLRAWWEEDRELSAKYYREVLGRGDGAPYFCEPWVCAQIIRNHLDSPSMLAIFPLSDWLSTDGSIRRENPAEERINVPAIPRYYWRYRMHLTLEDLLSASSLNSSLKEMIASSGRL